MNTIVNLYSSSLECSEAFAPSFDCRALRVLSLYDNNSGDEFFWPCVVKKVIAITLRFAEIAKRFIKNNVSNMLENTCGVCRTRPYNSHMLSTGMSTRM